jgi:hypothetical protein
MLKEEQSKNLARQESDVKNRTVWWLSTSPTFMQKKMRSIRPHDSQVVACSEGTARQYSQ